MRLVKYFCEDKNKLLSADNGKKQQKVIDSDVIILKDSNNLKSLSNLCHIS